MSFAGGELFALGWRAAGIGKYLLKGAGKMLEAVPIPKSVQNTSEVLLNTAKQLQAKFKHAVDFGVMGNYNKANAAEFRFSRKRVMFQS